MADEDRFLEDDVGATDDMQSGQKAGLLPAVVIKILKWSALIIAAIIFIVTVVVVTVGILNRGNQVSGYATISEQYQGKPPILDWYNNIGEIRGRSADVTPHTVIVETSIGYQQGDKTIQTELIQRTPQLRDLVRSYFSSKTAAELRPEREEEIKTELREMINGVMSQGKIREVIFQDFNVIEF